MASYRVQSSRNIVLDGRLWQAGRPQEVSETEIDKLTPDLTSGVLRLLDDPAPIPEPVEASPIGDVIDDFTAPLVVDDEDGDEDEIGEALTRIDSTLGTLD